MRENIRKVKLDYYISDELVLFNPAVRYKDSKKDRDDPNWWLQGKEMWDLLKQDDWWEVSIFLALPKELMGKLTIVHNEYIRPYSLAPSWQLHRSFTTRDSNFKLTGYTEQTFDTAIDKEHMLLVAKQRFEEILQGEPSLEN